MMNYNTTIFFQLSDKTGEIGFDVNVNAKDIIKEFGGDIE